MSKADVIELAYLAAGVLFILALKGLTHPRSAVRGNLLGALGMLVAVVATLLHQEVISYGWLMVGWDRGRDGDQGADDRHATTGGTV